MKSQQTAYYPYFDFLRILLASVVMFGHDNVITWSHSGKLAVDIFFALSGWLIGGILVKTDASQLPRFYFARALRIWVPYYIALLLLVVASLLKDPINAHWFEFMFYKLSWVYNLFGVPQLAECKSCMPLEGTGNHFWSVNTEEQFYLLAPLLLVIFYRYGRSSFTWLAVALFCFSLDIYAPLSFGVLAAVLNHHHPNFYEHLKAKIALGVMLVVAVVGFFITDDYEAYAPFFSISLVLILAIKGEKTAFGSFLGGISYPLYLNHWIGVFFFNLVLEPFGLRDSWLRQILAAAMGYAIAAFLYWFIERKVLALRERLYTAKRGIGISIVAYLSIIFGLLLGLSLYPSIPLIIALAIFVAVFGLVLGQLFKVKKN